MPFTESEDAPEDCARGLSGCESGAVIILLHDFPISMSPNEGRKEGRKEGRIDRVGYEREREREREMVLLEEEEEEN